MRAGGRRKLLYSDSDRVALMTRRRRRRRETRAVKIVVASTRQGVKTRAKAGDTLSARSKMPASVQLAQIRPPAHAQK